MSNHLILKEKYKKAIEIVKEASNIAKRFYEKNKDNLIVKIKNKNDIFTEADVLVEDFIKTSLTKAFPEDTFLGEESFATLSQINQSLVKDFTNYNQGIWIIDPIDGTTNFINGIPSWTVTVAYLFNQEIVIGIIYDPNLNECFHAMKNTGAFLNNQRIFTKKLSNLQKGILTTSFSYKSIYNYYLPLISELMKQKIPFQKLGPATIMLAYVAMGRFSSIFLNGVYLWDISAGMLLIKEAGGITNDLSFNNLIELKTVIGAANNNLFQALITILKQVNII